MSRARRHPLRAGGRPSYREDFDSDNKDETYSQSDSELQPPSSPVLRRAARRSSLLDSHSDSQNVRRSARASHGKKRSLREPDTDEGDELDGSEAEDAESPASNPAVVVIPVRQKRRQQAAARPGPAKRLRANNPSSRAAARVKAPHRPARPKHKADPSVYITTDGFSPPWVDLPYQVIVRIFEYASWQYAPTNRSRNSWLLSASLTCKSFMEPALTVLYNCLSVYDSKQRESMLDTLLHPPKNSMIDYHAKIQNINFNERFLLSGWDPMTLVTLLPAIKSLDIWSSRDIFRGHPQLVTEKWWWYPPAFLESLKAISPGQLHRLGFFRLNCMNFEKLEHIQLLGAIFSQPGHAFNLLKAMTVTNYMVTYPYCEPKFQKEGFHDSLTFMPFLADMPNLRNLRFEFCRGSALGSVTDLNEGILRNLCPLRLETLELHCCLDDSQALAAWLRRSGGNLRRLSVAHCQNLNLRFLPDLASSCPKLEELYIDLTFFDHALSERVIPPGFDELITADEAPTWPETLRSIHLLRLRRWTSDATFAFFTSLVQAAPRLRDLRTLVLSASIDIAWQARSTFREEWIARFEQVFLRKQMPPNKNLVSKKAWRQYTEKRAKEEGPKEEDIGRFRKRSGVNYNTSGSGSTSSESDGDDDMPLAWRGSGKKSGVRGRAAASLHGQLASVLGPRKAPPATHAPGAREERQLVVQGLCDTVEIRIDNGRPTEKELHEEDFLDASEFDDSDEDYRAE